MRRLTLAETPVDHERASARVPLTAPLAPVHKMAMGIAVGTFGGAAVFALTVFHVVLQPTDAPDIGLLAHYFNGYDVSWKGAGIGLCWGFLCGFVAGWFVAFVRNFIIAVRVWTLKGKADLAQARDFLDHI